LRRDLTAAAERFPQDVLELQALFAPPQPGQAIRAVPGAGLEVPIWILGSACSALSSPPCWACPSPSPRISRRRQLHEALAIYRDRFEPSARLERPYAMVAVNAFAAETDNEGQRLFTSLQQAFLNLRRGTPGPLPPAVDSMEGRLSPAEQEGLDRALAYSAVGSRATVRQPLEAVIAATQADELIVTGHIHEHAARLRSFEIVASLRHELGPLPARSPVEWPSSRDPCCASARGREEDLGQLSGGGPS
jgi:luciferase family oxidoreductase group 1